MILTSKNFLAAYFILAIGLAAFMLLAPAVSFAQCTETGGIAGEPCPPPPPSGAVSIGLPNPLTCGEGDEPGAECVLNVIIRVLWVIAIPLATLMILVGAFLLMTSAGNPEKVESGKNTIKYAILGLIIIILSSSIISIIQDILRKAAN